MEFQKLQKIIAEVLSIDDTDIVQEIAVMRTEQDGGLAVAQVFFEPHDGLVVEMVRRFVHDEQVAGHDQGPGQSQALALAAGQFVDGLGKIGNAQLTENDLGMGFQFPRLLFVHFGTEGDDGCIVIALDRFFIALEELHDRQVAVEDAFQDRMARHELRFLRQVMDARLGIAPDRAAVGVGQAGNDFQERRLAGAVKADEAQFLAAVDGKGHVVEEDAQAIGFLYIFYCQYIHYMLHHFLGVFSFTLAHPPGICKTVPSCQVPQGVYNKSIAYFTKRM